jgi:hypothetical protein
VVPLYPLLDVVAVALIMGQSVEAVQAYVANKVASVYPQMTGKIVRSVNYSIKN